MCESFVKFDGLTGKIGNYLNVCWFEVLAMDNLMVKYTNELYMCSLDI